VIHEISELRQYGKLPKNAREGAVMMRRIIAIDAKAKSDDVLTPELHKALTDRLGRLLEDDGGQAFYRELLNVSAAGNDGKPLDKAAQAYLDRLPEPQRTMLTMRREGCSPTTIAKSMGLQARAVCKALSKIYADFLSNKKGGAS
jgi:hypothetical protein